MTSRRGKEGRAAEITAEGADMPQALHHKMPVAWLSAPLPSSWLAAVLLGFSEEAMLHEIGNSQLAGGTQISRSTAIRPVYPPPQFLSCCVSQHTLNLLAANTCHVLSLEPFKSLFHFTSIWARNMPTRIPLDFYPWLVTQRSGS